MKKMFSLVLALVMALSLTTIAWGATNVGSLSDLTTALSNGDSEIVLTTDISSSGIIEITQDVEIDLGGKTITGTGNRLFRITAGVEVTFKNGTIANTASGGRCIETRTGDIVLNLDNVTLTATNGSTQALTVGGSGNNIKVNVTNGSSIVAGNSGYGIITFNPVTMTIKDSSVSGYIALYVKPADGSLGSAGSVFDVKGSTLSSTNNASADPSNCAGTIQIQDNNITVNIDADSTVKAVANTNPQANIRIGNTSAPAVYTGVVVNIEDGAELVGTILDVPNDAQDLSKTPVTVPAEYADELVAEGYVVAVDSTGVVVPTGVSVPAPVGGASVAAKSYKMTSNGTLMVGNVNAIYAPAVAAVLNDDGKQTNTADVSHYTFDGENCVVAASLADADYVLYSDVEGKNVMMYLKKAVTAYDGTGTVYTNFGKACGQVTYTAQAGKTYYTTNANGDAGIYVADAKGTKALMVGGNLVLVNATPVATTAAAVKHAAVPTVKDGKITGYTCATCKIAAIEAPNFMSIPKGATVVAGNWYFPAAAAPAAGTTSSTVTSAQTFDAGIAMYVGMSVMAAAGSAVVIGKKKD